MGDERTALAAVLLAGDLGYAGDQIVLAGVAGRLQPGGSILSADGTALTPDYEPSEILDDDVTGETSEASGFRSPPERLRLSSVLKRLNQNFDDDRGSLLTILVFFDFGYSLEQIVLAILADGLVQPGKGCLSDENGNVIQPEWSPEERWVGWCRAATSTTVSPADTTAPGVTTPDATDPAAEPEGEGVHGGSLHHVTTETPGLDIGGAFCLDYSEPLQGDFRLSLTACTDAPRFDIVHDLDGGTIDGDIDLDLECPGLSKCRGKDTVVATVSGNFGPFTYGRQPEAAPADWPFPTHHWYSGSDFWWAGGPIELDVSIAGDHYILDTAYPAARATTITGWAESTLSPSSRKPGELPTKWMVDLRVIIEYEDTIERRWDFYTGYFSTFEETGVDIPSWRK